MLFAVCHPSLSASSQVALALRILCGFGIDEIANAFLTNKETINKRLARAKEKLRVEQIRLQPIRAEVPEIKRRLESVLTCLYLLFSEGHYSESHDAVLREDLCLEAMRLTYLLIENEISNQPETNALMALMCFHSSRFDSRTDINGELILYQEQDETLWNQELIMKGAFYLHAASVGTVISRYHLEAGIAYWLTNKQDSEEKWASILGLYDQLSQMDNSPIAALNRIFAFAKLHGKASAIAEAEKLKMEGNHFYFALLGDLYSGINNEEAALHLAKALSLARTQGEKQALRKKLDGLRHNAGAG